MYTQITAELGLNDLRERVWQILPCSARTGEGLQEGRCTSMCTLRVRVGVGTVFFFFFLP